MYELCITVSEVTFELVQLHFRGFFLLTCDARHEKTNLKIFVVVIPKEGLAGWGPANPSLGMTLTTKYYSTDFIAD